MPKALNLVFWFKVKPSEKTSFPPVKQALGGERDLRSCKALIWLLVSQAVNGPEEGERKALPQSCDLVSGVLWLALAVKAEMVSPGNPSALLHWQRGVTTESTRKFCVLKTRGRRSNPSWPSIILGFLFRQAPAVEKLNQRIRFRKPYPPVPGPDLFKGSCSDVKMK